MEFKRKIVNFIQFSIKYSLFSMMSCVCLFLLFSSIDILICDTCFVKHSTVHFVKLPNNKSVKWINDRNVKLSKCRLFFADFLSFYFRFEFFFFTNFNVKVKLKREIVAKN